MAWVKGRWRTADGGQGEATAAVPRADVFRSPEYIKAVRALAWHEFRGLSRSTINAVLAESNHCYLDARRTLVTLSSASWRFSISSLFLRRRAVNSGSAEAHPLVVWRSTGQGSIIPAIRTTGNAELDRELYDALVQPLKERTRAEREATDRDLAVRLNNDEAEEAGAMHECSCCFATSAFEEITSCSEAGHTICFRCVQHSIKEALFGQGWHSINPETGTLKCLAADADGCTGHVSTDHIHRALMEEKSGPDMLLRLDRRLAEHSLAASKLPLVHCPFCSYAEIDDIYMPSDQSRPGVVMGAGARRLLLCVLLLAFWALTVPVVLVTGLACLLLGTNRTIRTRATTEWRRAVARHCRRRRGLRFRCQNPQCARASCLSCHKPWTDIHVCHESSLVALRTQVEQAMSLAVKRVCPRCGTSFVKTTGCNKLTCPCGYKMCYVCRADLGDEGYRHFCDHFRPNGDPRPCRECDRCNLWESEDLERVLREAREEAERRWKETEKRDLSGPEKAYLETGVAAGRGGSLAAGLRRALSARRAPTLPAVLDVVAELLLSG